MKASINLEGKTFTVDFSEPIDISIPLREGLGNVNAFFAPPLQIEPVVAGSFIGDVRQGGAVNFKNVRLNPHGNGTHTECVGHICAEPITLNRCLRQFCFLARLVSIYPQKVSNGDRIINLPQIVDALRQPQNTHMPKADALIIRTLPNDALKMDTNYSGGNPPYIAPDAMKHIVEMGGFKHLLVDLPSVDREEDGGKLAAHKAFWQYPGKNVRLESTITELVYVPTPIGDGWYLLHFQITALEMDASPSKPVLYKLQ